MNIKDYLKNTQQYEKLFFRETKGSLKTNRMLGKLLRKMKVMISRLANLGKLNIYKH